MPRTADALSTDAALGEPASHADLVPVMRPRLPAAQSVLPYLLRIDAGRVYSNFGPLVSELEQRLSLLMSLSATSTVLAASGTLALSGAILAAAGRARASRPLAVVPDHTFVATALAAEECGYRVLLVDVDAATWALGPESLFGHPRLEEVGVVIPAAPYGRAVAQGPWRAFRQRTGIPVVIDGAASFESVVRQPRRFLGGVPVALSFHATKTFATGEGGAVVCTDAALRTRIVRALNFGFYDSRDCAAAGVNGKMSEYHAAVGLAELDGWAAKQADYEHVHGMYRSTLAQAGLGDRFVGTPDLASCYALFRCASRAEAAAIRDVLDAGRVGHRFWYGAGLHAQSHFASCEGDPLPASRDLAPTLLGLPSAPDLSQEAIDRVVRCLVAGVAAPT